jgi:hypothetical protein
METDSGVGELISGKRASAGEETDLSLADARDYDDICCDVRDKFLNAPVLLKRRGRSQTSDV